MPRSSTEFITPLLDKTPSVENITDLDEFDVLAERLADEMADAWRRGEHPPAEEFFVRYPQLADHTEAAIRLIYEEMCLRQEFGQEATYAEVVHRFPQWQSNLKALFDCHRLMGPAGGAPIFPKVGDALGDFRILAELERGALGRVYLASQPFLADRPVVLKMTPCDGHEHLSLARLLHTHIVPLYSVQDFPSSNLRVLCMPYLGGATMADLLDHLHNQPPALRTGKQLLEALDAFTANRVVPMPSQGPARPFFARTSYVQAICWIGACLADALRYAHERGLVHLDLKPGNILIAADVQPMLLDFHLAREPIKPDGPRPDWLGGTPSYMSPEQQAALESVKKNQPIPAVVDGRSDIYSLGLLLYESLGGSLSASAESELPRLHYCNIAVSRGLSDLVRKCLAADPRDRYDNAAALAADLRRHLNDLPLRGVRNHSLSERWNKWRRRRPQALAVVGMILAALAAIMAGTTLLTNLMSQRTHYVRTERDRGRESFKKRDYADAIRCFTSASKSAGRFPADIRLKSEIDDQLHLARRGEVAQQLHVLADKIRFLSAAESLTLSQMQTVHEDCREIWDHRSDLLDRSRGTLESELEQRLQMDLLDVATFWADTRVRTAAKTQANAAQKDSLDFLAEVEKSLGPSVVLASERRELASTLGMKDLAEKEAARAAQLASRSASDHVAVGRRLLQNGLISPATAEFQLAIEQEPDNFWANFYQGICAFRLKLYPDAISAFRVCITLKPSSAECYYNRGRAFDAAGQSGNAIKDYNRALELKPNLGDAALNRGILHYHEKRYAEATADMQRALQNGTDPATAHFNLALIYFARSDRPAALASVQQALQANPHHKEALELRERLK